MNNSLLPLFLEMCIFLSLNLLISKTILARQLERCCAELSRHCSIIRMHYISKYCFCIFIYRHFWWNGVGYEAANVRRFWRLDRNLYKNVRHLECQSILENWVRISIYTRHQTAGERSDVTDDLQCSNRGGHAHLTYVKKHKKHRRNTKAIGQNTPAIRRNQLGLYSATF